ncbi:helix-turn-helix domain-containing protein [Mesobacillus zeae]|uniref:helix-turn-helix domain-containing protein n=1 Tax=Mesobacillus zeae TaxID=1917180 RepID=UPI00300BA3CF
MAIYFTLREILIKRGITERQFAKQVKIREGTLYDICNNKIKRIPVELIDRISEELNLEPGEWIKRKN